MPLGIMPAFSTKPAVEIELQPGDVVAMITDGVFEYEDAAGVPYGDAPVAELILARPEATAAELVAAIVQDVERFAAGAPQNDDMTVVLLKRAER